MKKNNPYQQLSTTDNDPKSLESQPDPPQHKDQQPDSSSPGPEFTLKKPGAFDKPGQDHLSAGSPSPGSAPSGKPAPDGNTIKDMVIANDCKSVDLRAERDGNKNGRVYTITFKVVDASGNIGTVNAKVTVPHSQGPKGTAIDSGVMYTVTNPYCP